MVDHLLLEGLDLSCVREYTFPRWCLFAIARQNFILALSFTLLLSRHVIPDILILPSQYLGFNITLFPTSSPSLVFCRHSSSILLLFPTYNIYIDGFV